MVKIIENINDIVSIWSEAFGDTKEDIIYFVNNVKHAKCFGVYENNALQSMLYLVDCKINDEMSHYIYAACTFKQYKNKGCMTKLLDYCKDKYNNICLIPANDGLVDFYAKRGFATKIDIEYISFDEIDEIKEYLFEGCELNHPFSVQYKGE